MLWLLLPVLAFAQNSTDPRDWNFQLVDTEMWGNYWQSTCLNRGEGFSCWKKNEDGSRVSTEISKWNGRVDELVMEEEFSCAVDRDGAKCVATRHLGLPFAQLAPLDKNPRFLFMDSSRKFFDDTRVIYATDEGVRESSIHIAVVDNVLNRVEDQLGWLLPLPLGKIKMLSVQSAKYLCAVDEADKLACRLDIAEQGSRDQNYHYTGAIQLNQVKTLAVGAGFFCAVDARGLGCHGIFDGEYFVEPYDRGDGSKSDGFHRPIPLEEGIWDVKIGAVEFRARRYQGICALGEKGVTCWNAKWPHDHHSQITEEEENFRRIENLKGPLKLISPTCALDREGLKCWDQDMGNVADLQKNLFTFASEPELTAEYFDSLRFMSAGLRAKYFAELAMMAKRPELASIEARYWLIQMAKPALLSSDTKYFVDMILPELEKSMKYFGKSYDSYYGKAEAKETEFGAPPVGARLASVKAALTALSEVVGADEKPAIGEALRALGAALSDPNDEGKFLALKESLRKFRDGKIPRSPKADFLWLVLERAVL